MFQKSGAKIRLQELTPIQIEYIKLCPFDYKESTWREIIDGLQAKSAVSLTEERAIFLIKFRILRDRVKNGIPSADEAPAALAELKDQLGQARAAKRRR